MTNNILYYGDNLKVLREHIPDKSIDLIYLDPPFNSKADYNILFKESTGKPSDAQITAFEDTWHWTDETERTFTEIVETAPANVIAMINAFRQFVGYNDVMAYLTMMCIRLLELKRVLKDTGSIYLHCDTTASHYLKILMDTVFEKKNFRNEITWCYTGASSPGAKQFSRKHDIILYYSKTDKRIFNADDVRIAYSEATLKRASTTPTSIFHGKRTKRTLYEGKVSEDWWQIPVIGSTAKERLGYPTQKPEALLERIILASSKMGDVVLDPFCGCGTTIVVAERLKRNWIGIDVTHLAINLIKLRLKYMFNLESKKSYTVIGEPEDLSGAEELASQNRFQFQWWVLSLIDARPYGDKKKGADTGIDGILYFRDEKEKVNIGIVSVKSGDVGVKDIRDLGHVIDREKAKIGVLITLKPPTKPMKTEAVKKGFYKSPTWRKNYPKIQILTVEDLFKGKTPLVPQSIPLYKKAKSGEVNLDLDY